MGKLFIAFVAGFPIACSSPQRSAPAVAPTPPPTAAQSTPIGPAPATTQPQAAANASPEPTASPAPTQPWPAHPFPDSVAGFPFGISVKKFIQICEAVGASAATTETGHMARCSNTVVSMPFEVRSVSVVFCAARACEYVLDTPIGAEQAGRLLVALAERYGTPAKPPGYSPRCHADPPSARYVWAWKSEQPGRGSMLRFVFDCDAGESPATRAAGLYYDNEEGVEWQKQVERDKEQNY